MEMGNSSAAHIATANENVHNHKLGEKQRKIREIYKKERLRRKWRTNLILYTKTSSSSVEQISSRSRRRKRPIKANDPTYSSINSNKKICENSYQKRNGQKTEINEPKPCSQWRLPQRTFTKKQKRKKKKNVRRRTNQRFV